MVLAALIVELLLDVELIAPEILELQQRQRNLRGNLGRVCVRNRLEVLRPQGLGGGPRTHPGIQQSALPSPEQPH